MLAKNEVVVPEDTTEDDRVLLENVIRVPEDTKAKVKERMTKVCRTKRRGHARRHDKCNSHHG